VTELNATSAALLGLLHDGPATGGELVARAARRYGAFFSMTRSQVYRELPALAEEGLLRLGKTGARASQQYVITPAGKRAFKKWINAETGSDHLRSTLVLRLVNAGRVTDRQRAKLVESARARHRERMAESKAAAKAAEDAQSKAVAAFEQAYAKAVLKLIDDLERA
jgi:DNA-binding PadR family transcriptional regulator